MKKVLTEREKLLITECKKILKEHPNLKKRKLNTIKDLDRRLFYLKVWSITESQPLHLLKNHERRCFRGVNCWHLDHIVPISYGFYNNIPPEKIGHISNLRFIRSTINMRKGHKLTTESHKVLRKIKRKK
jgi:5-methylcytosine-specific restriction endonuclease McrA